MSERALCVTYCASECFLRSRVCMGGIAVLLDPPDVAVMNSILSSVFSLQYSLFSTLSSVFSLQYSPPVFLLRLAIINLLLVLHFSTLPSPSPLHSPPSLSLSAPPPVPPSLPFLPLSYPPLPLPSSQISSVWWRRRCRGSTSSPPAVLSSFSPSPLVACWPSQWPPGTPSCHSRS